MIIKKSSVACKEMMISNFYHECLKHVWMCAEVFRE